MTGVGGADHGGPCGLGKDLAFTLYEVGGHWDILDNWRNV